MRAQAVQQYGADHPKAVAARRELDTQLLAEHVERVVADWPDLSRAQLDRIAALLRTGRRPRAEARKAQT